MFLLGQEFAFGARLDGVCETPKSCRLVATQQPVRVWPPFVSSRPSLRP
jgi:hypothetical protein